MKFEIPLTNGVRFPVDTDTVLHLQAHRANARLYDPVAAVA